MLRDFNPRDVPWVKRITEEALRENYPTSLYLDIFNWWREGFLVMEEGGEVVGFLAGVLSGPQRSRVLMLAVDKPHRSKGYGTLLMEEFLKRSGMRGVKTVELEVRRSNIPAIRFYQRLGFEIIHVLPHFYTDGEDGYKLLKEF